MTRVLLLAAALLLSACAGKPPTVVETRPAVPPTALLTCRAAPAVPRDAETQRDVARYVVRLHEAGEDCRSKLGAVRAWALEESAE